MSFLFHALRRSAAVVASAILLGIAFAGCAGGSGTTPLPPAHTNAVPVTGLPDTAYHGPRLLGKIDVSRAQARHIAGRVVRSSQYLYGGGTGIIYWPPIQLTTPAHGLNMTNYGGPVMDGRWTYVGFPPIGKYELLPVLNFNVLVNNSDESAWGGKIAQFEHDLFSSNMINILDQYIGKSATGNYVYSGDVELTYNTSGPLSDSDIEAIVHAAAAAHGNWGYQSIYHIFFDSSVQPGQLCTGNSYHCYGSSFCASHGSMTFNDIYGGPVMYTLEPYQGISYCNGAFASSPNGALVDPTASALSHEMFEAFTDPIAPTQNTWGRYVYDPNFGVNRWQEIGDLCSPFFFLGGGVQPQAVTLNGDSWDIQSEYSNKVGDCTYDNVNPAY